MSSHSRRARGTSAVLLIAALLASGCTTDDDANAASSQDKETGQFSGEDPESDSVVAEIADGVEIPDYVDVDRIYVEEGTPPLTEEDLAEMDPEREITVECDDPVRLAENEDHDPAGWPQGREGGQPLPDPECHPDFIEIQAWEHLEEFSAHREGIETSTPVRSPGMSDQELYEVLWEASEARASWEP